MKFDRRNLRRLIAEGDNAYLQRKVERELSREDDVQARLFVVMYRSEIPAEFRAFIEDESAIPWAPPIRRRYRGLRMPMIFRQGACPDDVVRRVSEDELYTTPPRNHERRVFVLSGLAWCYFGEVRLIFRLNHLLRYSFLVREVGDVDRLFEKYPEPCFDVIGTILGEDHEGLRAFEEQELSPFTFDSLA